MQNFVNMRYFLPITVILCSVLLGCDTEETIKLSSETQVNTFSFYEDTINPGLRKGVYKIEHSSDTGLIYNLDSLQYGTRLDSVRPYVTYKETPGSASFILPDTTILSTGSDTINFTQHPIYLHVISSDLEHERWYRILLTVHQADPDLYVWNQLATRIFEAEYCESRAFYHNGEILVFVNTGLATQLYSSSDGTKWSMLSSGLSTLPTPCHVRDIVQHNDTLYYISENNLYLSLDGETWQQHKNESTNFTLVNMLMSYNNKAWCLIEEIDSQQLQFGVIDNNTVTAICDIDGIEGGYLPHDFPISDFASLSFESSSERPRAMIVGGRNMLGNIVNARWNLEYSRVDGYRIKNFTISQPSFKSLTGVSLIQYAGKLMMFGGIDNNFAMRSDILYSDDEGMNWYVPDSSKNQLPACYFSRQNQSVLLDNNHNIYIIGGQSKNQSFGDVYRGYLNSAKWEK